MAGALSADLVLRGGRIITFDPKQPQAQALAVRGDRIVAVGSNRGVEGLMGPDTEVIELGGRTTLPGVADIHVHLASDASRVQEVECRDFFDGVSSTAEIVERLRRRAAQTPPGQWLVGRGSPMQDFRLKERRFPTKEELDVAAPHHPAYVTFGAHITIANTLALRERGITRDTPSPAGGTIEKDAATGEPTGLLRERAQFLIRGREAGQEAETLAEHILLELERLPPRGVTTIHDIVVSREEVQAYQLLDRAGRLPLRVQLLFRVIESQFSKESLLDLGLVHGFGSDYLKIGGIKLSIDGGFTGKNAAFSEPLAFEGEKNPGLIRIDQEELDDTVWRYHGAGMRICTHAIGDIALDMVLEAYGKALTKLPRPDHRHRIEHGGNWLMTPQRLERCRRLGVIPVPNPSIFYHLGEEVLTTLGPKRCQHVFPFRTLLEAGFPLVFGSDSPGYWPVDPLRDIGNAVSRKTRQGLVLSPEEAISVEEALRCQTVNAAYAGFQEERLGTLEPGKLADLMVLGQDPFTFPPERFRELPVDLTMVGGRIVYRRGS